jgi:hypothetical protein
MFSTWIPPSPRLRIQFGAKTFTLVDKDRRKYQELNDVLAADFDMAHRWQQRYLPGLQIIVTSENLWPSPSGL